MFNAFGKSALAALVSLSIGGFATTDNSAANAVTVASNFSYSGDICDDFDADGGVSGTDYNDCDQMVFENGPVGTFTMELTLWIVSG